MYSQIKIETCSMVNVSSFDGMDIPAQLTSMKNGPWDSARPFSSVSITEVSRVVMSKLQSTTFCRSGKTKCRVISLLASSSLSLDLAMMETFAPRLATSEATASPIPLDPPVMTTCLPRSSDFGSLPNFRIRFRFSRHFRRRTKPIPPASTRPSVIHISERVIMKQIKISFFNILNGFQLFIN